MILCFAILQGADVIYAHEQSARPGSPWHLGRNANAATHLGCSVLAPSLILIGRRRMLNMGKNLQFAQFGMERSAFEVRFAPALLHWDQSGATWSEFISLYPGFRPTTGEPGKTVFTLGNRYQCTISLESALVLAAYPERDLTEFAEMAGKFIHILFRSLRITEVSRAGLRLNYFCELDDKNEAANALLEMNLIKVIDTTQFGVEGTPMLPKYALRWEGKVLGMTLRLDALMRTMNLEAPFGMKALEPGMKPFETISRTEHGIALDVDLFTTAPVPVGAFITTDWITQSSSKIKKGAASLFQPTVR